MTLLFYGFPFLSFLGLTSLLSLNPKHSRASLLFLSLSSLFLLSSGWEILRDFILLENEVFISEMIDITRIICLTSFLSLIIIGNFHQNSLLEKQKNHLFRGTIFAGIVSFLFIPLFYFYPFLSINFLSLLLFTKILWIIFGLFLIEVIFRNTDRNDLLLLKYFLLGAATLYIYDLAYFSNAFLFQNYEESLYLARGGVWGLISPLLAISAARFKKWSTNLRISRNFIFHSAVILGAGLYLISMSLFSYYLHFTNLPFSSSFQILFIVFAILILFVAFFSHQLKSKLHILISRNFFAYRYDYREEWIKFIQTLSNSKQGLHSKIITAISQIIDSDTAALWIYDEEENNYKLKYSQNFSTQNLVLSANDKFIKIMQKDDWIINLKDFNKRNSHEMIPEWITSLEDAWLILPLNHNNLLYGFILIGKPIARESIDIDWETYLLLKIISKQVTTYIAEEMTGNKLHHAKQLEDFHKRFAFVVHDLKNLINQLSLMTTNSKKHIEKKEFQQDMIETLSNSVEKMKRMLVQLSKNNEEDVSNFQENNEANIKLISGEDLRTALKSFVLTHHNKDNIHLTLNHIPQKIEIDLDAFLRSFEHLVQNGLDAMAEKESEKNLIIQDSIESNVYQMAILDKGPGMSEDFIQNKLFTPLKSTKKDGFGIGAYQARELLKKQKLELQVESEEGKGTKIKILFKSR